jgi:hypothetical protein
MADLTSFIYDYGSKRGFMLLNQAIELAKSNPNLHWGDIQNTLKIGYKGAVIIHDWLCDEYLAEPKLTNHRIQRGRIYTLNTPHPSLEDMAEKMGIGRRKAFLILIELQKKGLVGIKPDLTFKRLRPSCNEEELLKQVKVWGKKYRGRCEPELLMRLMYIDYRTARRISNVAIAKLGLGRKKGQWVKKFNKIKQ